LSANLVTLVYTMDNFRYTDKIVSKMQVLSKKNSNCLTTYYKQQTVLKKLPSIKKQSSNQ